jgi:hypothetical protein
MTRSYTSHGSRRPPFIFTLDGIEFACTGGFSFLDMIEMMRNAGADAATPKGMAAIADLFSGAMGDEQYERFRRHCREYATDPDDLVEIMKDVVEHFIGNPSPGPGHSAPGPSNTGTGSTAGSPSNGSVPELTPEQIERFRQAVYGLEHSPGHSTDSAPPTGSP